VQARIEALEPRAILTKDSQYNKVKSLVELYAALREWHKTLFWSTTYETS